jgi:hypothetical protein
MSRRPSSTPKEAPPYEQGGLILGSGSGMDPVLTRLHPGEFIITPTIMAKLRDPLENMKAALEHTAFKFANGGFVNGRGVNGLYYDQDGYPEPPPPD